MPTLDEQGAKQEVRKIILDSLNNFFDSQIVYDTPISRKLLAKDIEENLRQKDKIKNN